MVKRNGAKRNILLCGGEFIVYLAGQNNNFAHIYIPSAAAHAGLTKNVPIYFNHPNHIISSTHSTNH